MDNVIILDDDEEEENTNPVRPISPRSSSLKSPKREMASTSTHITESPFDCVKRDKHVLKLENEKLFSEFVSHCTPLTQDCPEVLSFLQAKHAKAMPEFLSSIEFRNALGRCLTRAQTSKAKTFVYINELCTLLKQHSAKRRASTRAAPSAGRDAEASPAGQREDGSPAAAAAGSADGTPSSSEAQGGGSGEGEEGKKAQRASRKQIAYLENLLKVYNDEIKRLQEKELSVDDMGKEDSSYIQEHKLKRKMMKIYDKLCELKSCNTLTGRVIEQRIPYKGTRYPEINKKIERYINSPDVRWSPPDYQDILRLVQRANERHGLSLSRSQQSQIAQDAFQDTGRRLQDRRHLDMVYNFGSHLTDAYKPTTDPALSDPTLSRKLRSNREVAVSGLEEVISKYAVMQDDTEEEERKKRQTKKNAGKVEEKEAADEEKEEEEEDDEDDVSSDPDIEEEIQASNSQEGDGEEEENGEPVNDSEGEIQESEGGLPSVEQQQQQQQEEEEEEEEDEDEGSSDNDLQSGSSSHRSTSSTPSPLGEPAAESPSPSDTPSQSEPSVTKVEEDSQWQRPVSISPPIATQTDSLPPSPVVVSTNEDLALTSLDAQAGDEDEDRPSSPATARKRKRNSEVVSQTTRTKRQKATSVSGSDSDIPLDMGVASSPLQVDSTRADSPSHEMVSSSQMTPPPKPNKVDKATQCDPEEVIELSDSE
ncbi:death domain-associated protein 6 isoform X2 [Engraulis encrasicolus]|uniref:death domain-associated protein 6 isoform X2 n=1 Tax=Engraulis encrasicolus TaxID=184585 RepID=UPI002FD2494B